MWPWQVTKKNNIVYWELPDGTISNKLTRLHPFTNWKVKEIED
ncbi:hypothetical protein [Peribacillus butanolivorans]